MESCGHYILQKYFSKHAQYNNMVELISKTILYLNYSQCLDVFPYHEKNQTYEYMKAVSFGKSVWSAYYTGVTLAMNLANLRDQELYKKMKEILVAMGWYYQMQVRIMKISNALFNL